MTTTERPVAIITGGAGGGIGMGISESLLNQGWNILVVDRDEAGERRLAAAFAAFGGRWDFVSGDVADPALPTTAVARALSRFGRLDGLVNSAAVGLLKRAGSIDPKEAHDLFNVNFWGAFRFVQAVLPELSKKGGSIVNIGSVHARAAARNYSLYAASKAALEAFTRGVALDYGREGVRANIVHPGLVPSPLNDVLHASLPDARTWNETFAQEKQALNRLTSPRDVGDLVAFLLGPTGAAITGQNLFVDAGTSSLLWNNTDLSHD